MKGYKPLRVTSGTFTQWLKPQVSGSSISSLGNHFQCSSYNGLMSRTLLLIKLPDFKMNFFFLVLGMTVNWMSWITTHLENASYKSQTAHLGAEEQQPLLIFNTYGNSNYVSPIGAENWHALEKQWLIIFMKSSDTRYFCLTGAYYYRHTATQDYTFIRYIL